VGGEVVGVGVGVGVAVSHAIHDRDAMTWGPNRRRH
jgi:hypothetical protein